MKDHLVCNNKRLPLISFDGWTPRAKSLRCISDFRKEHTSSTMDVFLTGGVYGATTCIARARTARSLRILLEMLERYAKTYAGGYKIEYYNSKNGHPVTWNDDVFHLVEGTRENGVLWFNIIFTINYDN